MVRFWFSRLCAASSIFNFSDWHVINTLSFILTPALIWYPLSYPSLFSGEVLIQPYPTSTLGTLATHLGGPEFKGEGSQQ